MAPDEKKAEAQPTLDSRERVKKEVDGILTKLGEDVKKENSVEVKKKLLRQSIAAMKKEQFEELDARIRAGGADLPRGFLDAIQGHVEVSELVNTQIRNLRTEVEAQRAAAEKKPEGWMASAGEALTTGAQKIGEWSEWLWGKTKTGVGTGFDKFMEGMKAMGDGFMKLWEMVKGPLNKFRESVAISLGSFVISLEKVLPTAVTETFNALVGNVGVFYATLNRLGVKIVAGATDAANASVEEFNRIYEQMAEWRKPMALDFPGFIREVAGRLRAQKGSLAFTLADMVGMANIISGEKPSATPAVAPGAVAAAPGTTPSVAVPATPASPTQSADAKVDSDIGSVSGEMIGKNIAVEGTPLLFSKNCLLTVGGKKFRIDYGRLTVGGMFVSVTSIQKVGDTLEVTGEVPIFGSGKLVVSLGEFLRVVREMKTVDTKKDVSVEYKNAKGELKSKTLTFVPLGAAN